VKQTQHQALCARFFECEWSAKAEVISVNT